MLIHRHVLLTVVLIASQVSCATADGNKPPTSSAAQAQPSALGSQPVAVDRDFAPAGKTATPANAEPATSIKEVTVRGTDHVIASRPATSPVEGPDSAFKFEETPIADVAHVILGQILKVDYVLHQPFTGTVTLSTKGSVSADQAVALLEGALQANGLLMARDTRGVYHIGRPEALKGIVGSPRQSGNGPLPPGYGAVIVPLDNIGAAEMASILRPMLPPEALVRVDTLRNLLVLVGTRNQAEGWLEIVSTFDIDLLKGMSIGVFPLKYASIKDVESALAMVTPGTSAANASGLSASSPTPGALQAATSAETPALLGGVRILPIERINSIIAVTSKAARLEDVRRWIERLDQPTNSSESQLFVYPVQNGSAQHLASVLSGIFGNGAPTPTTNNSAAGVSPALSSATAYQGLQQGSNFGGSSTGIGGIQAFSRPSGSNASNTQSVTSVTLPQGTRLMADELNNAILIYGNKSEFTKIDEALRKLDVPPTQVLIEASIIEVTLSDDLKYGIQWLFTNNSSGQNYNGTGVLSTVGGGVLGGAVAGFSYTLRNAAGNVRAVLNALAEKSLVKVISSPSLMVLDNHTASIAVGNQQPIRSGETIAAGGLSTTSIQYKDTGVTLAVTPSVNAGNIVTMQINQSVTDVGAIDDATRQRAFLQRRIDSKVAIRSGETLVLGGLIRDNTTTGKSGIPLLQDIPVLGVLFGGNNTNVARTELLVVITPRVVRSDQEVRDVSSELRARMKSFRSPDSSEMR